MEDARERTAAGGHTGEAQKVSLPQLDPASYPSQLFWLTVAFVALYLLVARGVLPCVHEVLEKRRDRRLGDIDRADALSREAEDARSEYEKLHADARGEAQRLLADSQAAIAATRERVFAELDGDIAEKLAQTRVNIGRTRETLRDKLAPVAREVAAQVVDRLIGVTPSEKQLEHAGKQGEGNG